MNLTKTVRQRVSLLTVAAMVGTALVWTVAAPPAPATAAGETIISTFYVPLFEDNAQAALFSVNNATANQLSSTTSVTVGAEDAIIYYDHWEDAYEADANVKVQPSTLVFGDGDTGNGNAATYCVPARCTGDRLPAGAVLRLNNSATVVPGPITTPRAAGTRVFDGRDKISSTAGLAVTHATWPTAIDALHSEMAAAFDTSRWGISFRAPVGVNTPAQGAGVQSFTYTGLEVMAREDGTQVSIDTNNDGDYLDAGDVNGTTIAEGQTVYVNGSVREGARVVATKPVQVFLMTGVIGSNYENRSFQVFPTEGLVNDYVAPASSARTSGTLYATVLYLFNPQTTAIAVTVTTPSGATPYTIPPGQTLNPAPSLPAGQAARVTATGALPNTFAAVAGIGTREDAANSKNYDWGYSLLPARVISDSLVVGWAPGSQNLLFSAYDPVWATVLANTTLFVDYDADPTTGASTDPNGSRYDVAYAATALSQLRITDAGDNDMTGARLYTVDGVGVAAAYGEDPAATTPVAFPGVDLGTTLFPSCGALCIRKLATISVDVDGDGLADPGDTLRWAVQAANTDYYALINPVLFDTLPPGVTYVPGSTTVVVNSNPPVGVADDIPPASLFPYDLGGRQITATIPVGSVVTAFFETVINSNFAGTAAICNKAIVTSQRQTILTPANGADTGCIPVDGMRITKTSNSGGNPVLPGQSLSYTIQVTNTSSSPITNVAVTDPLPAGLTFVSSQVTRPAATTTIADDFETVGSWAGSTGYTAWSAGEWTETDNSTVTPIVDTGRIRKVTDLGDLSVQFRNGAAVNEGISRLVGNLSAFTSVTLSVQKRCTGLEAGDVVLLEIRPNGSAGWTTVATYSNCSEGAYVANSFPLSSGQYGTATEVRFRVSDAFGGGGTDNFYVDNLVFSASGPRAVATVPGVAPPNLVTLLDLLPTESATIVVNTTVNSPYTATDEITNIATVRAGNQVARASVVDCVRCFDYSDAPSTYNGDGGLTPARARAASRRTLIADTFQSIGYAGSTGTAPWSGTSWVETDGGGAGPASGLVQNVIDASTRSIRVGSTTATTATSSGLSRVIGNLSSFSTVNLGFDYRCSNLTAGDVIELQIRPTAAAAWTMLQTFSNCNNATIYSGQNITLVPANYGTATEIRLSVTNAFDTGALFFFDDVQVQAVADGITVGPRLGTVFDREVQGSGGAAPFPATPPAAPIGDDSPADDEDGVTVPAVDVDTIEIPIAITDDSGGVTYVNGWFDWSNDGTFQANESLFASGSFVSATGGLTVVGGAGQAPGPGTYTVTVNVPDLEANLSGYAIGDTVYSRFRVATALADVGLPTGPSADGEVEDYSTTLNTLPVDLAYLASQRTGDLVAVQWRTAQEVDNLGFNLYAEDEAGALTLLSPEMVLSKAPTSIEQQAYELTVTTSADQLWLEDVSLDGKPEMHGPYEVGQAYGDPNEPQPIDWAGARRQLAGETTAQRWEAVYAARAASQERLASPAAAAVGPVARLEVDEGGLYEATYGQLLAVGVDLAGVPAASLAITDQHGPVQLEVVGGATFGPGSALRFLGEPIDTLYAGTNVYLLHIDPSLARRVSVFDPTPPPVPTPAPVATTTTTKVPVLESGRAAPPTGPTVAEEPSEGPPPTIAESDDADDLSGRRPRPTTTTTTAPATTTTTAAPPTPVTAYTETVTAELDNEYSLTAPGDDPWFQEMLVAVAGYTTTGSATVAVSELVAGQPAYASVDLWGITRYELPEEHHVRLRVNGEVVADQRFDDNEMLRLQGPIPAGVLVEGPNTLDVTLLDDTGVQIDLIAIDAWQVSYQRNIVAVDGRLDLTASGDLIDVGGMPAGEVLAYRVGADASLMRMSTTVEGEIVQVPGAATAQRYVLSAVGSLRSPVVAPALAATDLLGAPADYLVVTNGAFTSTLAPLVAYHQSQGRTVKVVDVADVYQAFGNGVVDAAAIDAYLAEAVPALGARWVLLVGADSVDYRDFDGDGSFSLMPSPYGATGFSVTFAPLDPAYADIDDDGVPDVALGRLPARTPAELATMITKTLTYANQTVARSVVLVSDADDGLDYAAVNDTVETRFAGWAVRRSDIDRQGADVARAELLAAIDGGTALTFYLGHSGTRDWTEAGLFDSTAAAALTNEMPTVVVQFGCWNTYYVMPTADTMAHTLLLNSAGGAAAVLGAAALTSSGNDIQLAGFLADQLATGQLTVGEAVVAAKRELQRNAGGATADVQLGWTMLGDPAIPAGGNG